jgi:trans-aconitate methyltransferase
MADKVTFDADYFNTLYRQDIDPWHFRTSEYERRKYAETLAALPRDRYEHIIELGSSIGELSVLLGARAERLTGVDTSDVAITAARKRCAGMSHVAFEQAQLPQGEWATQAGADALVISEVLYYLSSEELAVMTQRMSRLATMADIVLVHWTGDTNYPMTGDDASEQFIRAFPQRRWLTSRRTGYRVDVTCAVAA